MMRGCQCWLQRLRRDVVRGEIVDAVFGRALRQLRDDVCQPPVEPAPFSFQQAGDHRARRFTQSRAMAANARRWERWAEKSAMSTATFFAYLLVG